MPATYENIATTTLGSATASVTFSAISSSFTDLRLVVTAQTSNTSGFFNVYPNNTRTAIYSRTLLVGSGTAAVSNRSSNQSTGFQVNCAPSTAGLNDWPIVFDLMNYSNTTTNKTVLARSGSASVQVEAWVWLMSSTSAISSIVIEANSTTFAAGSTFTLYGIKAA